MVFKEKVQSMTAKEIIMAMVNGLKKEHVKVDINTFGCVEDDVCYGCAATNAICEISGKVFTADNIKGWQNRGFFIGRENINFVAGFETAIDVLRSLNIYYYNRIAEEYGFATIDSNHFGKFNLPQIENDNYKEAIIKWEEFANTLD